MSEDFTDAGQGYAWPGKGRPETTAIETVREALETLCDAADFPGAAQEMGEVKKDWHPCVDAHHEASDALSRIERVVNEAIRKREIEGEQWRFALAKAERVVEALRKYLDAPSSKRMVELVEALGALDE